MSEHLIETFENGVCTLTMNRPEVRNAMSGPMMDALNEAIPRVATDRRVRAVVLTGAGGAFCAGGDVKGFASETRDGKNDDDGPSIEERVQGLFGTQIAESLMDGQSEGEDGTRVRVWVTPPALHRANKSDLPVGIGRARGQSERIAWFFANTYCSCSIMGDGCTGMFYTLASCHQTRCGMPKRIRTFVGERIDKGMTDAEILGELRKSRGPLCLKSHLLR